MAAALASFAVTMEKLIQRFESDRAHYLSKNYSEAQARVDFISPLFKALGWDVEIDDLVFRLYGITDEERKVIVGAEL